MEGVDKQMNGVSKHMKGIDKQNVLYVHVHMWIGVL